MKNRQALERLLRGVLCVCLLLLAVLTPLWWAQEHPRPAPTPSPAPEPTPSPSPDPAALRAARYRAADEAERAGLLGEALAVWEALGDYADSAARAERCRALLYEAAQAYLDRRELASAASLLAPLGAYRDSARWLRYCERHSGEARGERSLLVPSRVYFRPEHGQGTLYHCAAGLFYVPDEPEGELPILLYYPGGADIGAVMLDTNAVAEYVSLYAPRALCFFAYENGFKRMDEHNRALWDTVEALLGELSRVPRALVLVGTSNGFYSAEHMALLLYEEEELPARALLSLDAGEDWGERDKLLSDTELARLAPAGTRFALFEQKRFNAGRDVIQSLLRAGLAVELIECDNGDHEAITRNAFRLGALSWALGECGLDARQYTLTRLAPDN